MRNCWSLILRDNCPVHNADVALKEVLCCSCRSDAAIASAVLQDVRRIFNKRNIPPATEFAVKTFQRILMVLATLSLTAACNDPVKPIDPVDQFVGFWVKGTPDLPPVTVEIRRESDRLVGQVGLSGVTYTWPAYVVDSMVVITNPVSSALAPFTGTLKSDGKMRAILRGGSSEVEVTLSRGIPRD